MQNRPFAEKDAPLFKYLTPSAQKQADVHSVGSGIYFTSFPGIEPNRGSLIVKKTVRELRKDAKKSAPKSLHLFFNAQQRRKRFNLPPAITLTIDIYAQSSLKRCARLDSSNFSSFTTRDLLPYFNPPYIIHIYNPTPMLKDFIHKQGNFTEFFNLRNLSLSSNISQLHGTEIVRHIKNKTLRLVKTDTDPVDVLNWHKLIPHVQNTESGLRSSTLHLALGIYRIRIGDLPEIEGYLISLNDKGPMMIIDESIVECSHPHLQLHFREKRTERGPNEYSTEHWINLREVNESTAPSMFQFERKNPPYFIPKPTIHPKDPNTNRKKTNRFHAEFKILNHLVNHLGFQDHPDKTAISGEIYILSEKTPCYGCLDVLWNQFNSHFPNIHLKYNFLYGIRATETGFQKMACERENSPIIVPKTPEQRTKGFAIHSEFLRTAIRPADAMSTYLATLPGYPEIAKFVKCYTDFGEVFKKFDFPYRFK